MNLSFLKRNINGSIFISIILIYAVLKAFSTGNDIDVYLFASEQLINQENIYAATHLNNYLYSPLFALLLWPLSLFDYSVARIIWAIINVVLTVRLWDITSGLIKRGMGIDSWLSMRWTIIVVFISVGLLNHNLILGQITIVILWLTFEGLYQIICRDRSVAGASLLALGITIKIIPVIGLFYLFFKGKYKAMMICIGFIIAGLFLPSLIIGHNYNLEMLKNWKETITPANDKYVFENYKGTQSLNALLPAYFYDFEDDDKAPANLDRKIASLSYDTLVIIMQSIRVLMLLSVLILIFYRYKQRENEPIYFYWEFSYLALLSALIFPHQQKYAMIYFVPAGSYMILFILLVFKLRWEVNLKYKIITVLASIQMFALAIMGRDLVGDYLVDIFDYYRAFGLNNLVFLVYLILIKPNLLIDMYERTASKTDNNFTAVQQNLQN